MIKRGLDLVGAIIGLLLTALPMALIALLIRWSMGKPVLFCQVRSGYRGEPFTIYKFRTMREASGNGEPRTEAERLTSLGRFLRTWSLDELPELFNVLKGDMSLVGPRPLLTDYLELYTPRQRRRHEVKPGITGWAQVHGRNAISWEEKFALDLWYVDNRNLLLDLKILLLTAVNVLRGRGISAPGHPSMPRFTGQGGRPR